MNECKSLTEYKNVNEECYDDLCVAKHAYKAGRVRLESQREEEIAQRVEGAGHEQLAEECQGHCKQGERTVNEKLEKKHYGQGTGEAKHGVDQKNDLRFNFFHSARPDDYHGIPTGRSQHAKQPKRH